MENEFFKKTFISHNIEIVVPNQSEQEYIHRKIVKELENGIVNNETKKGFFNIINLLVTTLVLQVIILSQVKKMRLIPFYTLVISMLMESRMIILTILIRLVGYAEERPRLSDPVVLLLSVIVMEATKKCLWERNVLKKYG
ncbi:hypothetical protein [Peribacillus simplex]|uniref:hypothetical protein n=1 Tax=Peribacillus simplex TaxID=1478 RepID=UPI002E2115F8